MKIKPSCPPLTNKPKQLHRAFIGQPSPLTQNPDSVFVSNPKNTIEISPNNHNP